MPVVTPLLCALLFGGPAATAGTLVVQTTVATEILHDGLPVVRTYGPGTVSLPDLAAGVQKLVVYRSGASETIDVEVPTDGRVRLLVGADTLQTDASDPRPPGADGEAEGPPPVLELRGEKGQRFSILLDGKRLAVLGPDRPLRLESLSVGAHTLELRSANHLTIWARGQVDLRPGDEVVLQIAEGRPVEAFGRAEAWQPSR